MIRYGLLVQHKTISKINKIIHSQIVRKLGTKRKDPAKEKRGP